MAFSGRYAKGVDQTDAVALLLRLTLGLMLVAHGANHLWGGGRIPGAARWFESMGLRHGTFQAWMSALTEIAAGTGLALGILTPLSAAACVGLMLVAGIVAHRQNGFFVFKEGYEYVLVVALVALAIAALGPGSASVDAALGIDDDLDGWTGALVAAAVGVVGGALLLVTSWRPSRPAAATPPAETQPAQASST